MRQLSLLTILDREGVRVTAAELRELADAGAGYLIDASRVERIGLAGLQLLLSVLRASAPGDPEVRIVTPSQPLIDAARLAGVTELLGLSLEVRHGV